MTADSRAARKGAAASWRDRYRDPRVVERYLADRFSSPLGALLHARQAAAVGRSLAARERPRVLEVAAGPARFAREFASAGAHSTFLDRSLPMLRAARSQEAAARGSLWIAADALALPCREASFDLVVAFRLLRHLHAAERALCYDEMARVLAPGGELLFDAVNERVSAPLRASAPADYPVPDQLYTEAGLRGELARTSFAIDALEPVQRRYRLQHRLQVLLAPRSRRLAAWAIGAVERGGGGEPLEWVVRCRRA